MKKTSFFILFIVLLLCFSACSQKKYSDTLSCAELSGEIRENDTEYGEYDEEYLKYFFADSKLQDDFCIAYSTDNNDITEIGIFHVPDEDSAKELTRVAEDYIEEMQSTQRAFIASYAPNEIKKLDSASVRRFGNYVIYSIAEDNESVFNKIEKRLLN